MSGYTRIIQSPYTLFVSFQKVEGRKKFDFLMNRFNESFPVKVWDEKRRAWLLAPRELPKLLSFSTTLFGKQGYTLQQENTTSSIPSQPFLI